MAHLPEPCTTEVWWDPHQPLDHESSVAHYSICATEVWWDPQQAGSDRALTKLLWRIQGDAPQKFISSVAHIAICATEQLCGPHSLDTYVQASVAHCCVCATEEQTSVAHVCSMRHIKLRASQIICFLAHTFSSCAFPD